MYRRLQCVVETVLDMANNIMKDKLYITIRSAVNRLEFTLYINLYTCHKKAEGPSNLCEDWDGVSGGREWWCW